MDDLNNKKSFLKILFTGIIFAVLLLVLLELGDLVIQSASTSSNVRTGFMLDKNKANNKK